MSTPPQPSIFYNGPKHKVVGLMQFILGAILCIFDIIVMVIVMAKLGDVKFTEYYESLWNGIPTMLCGALAYEGQKRNNGAMLVGCMVLAIINILLYFPAMVISGLLVTVLSIGLPFAGPLYLLIFTGKVIWLIVSVIMFPLSIVQAALCCGDKCPGCCCYNAPNEGVAGGAPEGHQMA